MTRSRGCEKCWSGCEECLPDDPERAEYEDYLTELAEDAYYADQ